MSRIKLLTTTQLQMTLLAVLLLLCSLSVSGTTNTQNETDTVPCIAGFELPAELYLADPQAALQALVTEDPDAMVSLLFDGEEVATIRGIC